MDQLIENSTSFELAIGGMTCASCAGRVEKSLYRVPGVRHVNVNLASETAHVEAVGTRLPELVAGVGRAGYTATERGAAKRPSRREPAELIAAALLSAPLLLGMFFELPGWLALMLATPVQFWLGARFYLAGFKALRAGTGNMDLLVALGISAAYFLSLADFARGSGPLYFESSAVVITLVRLGKYLEGRAKREAVTAVTGLARLRPAVAHGANGDVPLARIGIGDILEIRAGERVPVDGVIVSGAGYIDESHLTGESLPVRRGIGDTVLAGALNSDAVLHLRASTGPGETFLDRMGRLIDAAQGSSPKIQRLVDRVSAVFVPVVVGIAVLTFAGWMLAGAAAPGALINAVSVLVIACPCALGLATPAAILAGTAAAAKHGILIRNADVLERAARLDLVIFDKTGTLTEGKPSLTGVEILGDLPRETILAVAAAMAAADNHPLSAALRVAGTEPAANIRSLPGRGIEGSIKNLRYILGSAALIADAGGAVPEQHASDGASRAYLALADGTLLAGFSFADRVREDAKAAISRLREMGCAVMMLSGDRAEAAGAVGRALGIDEMLADVTPEQKRDAVQAKRAGGQVVAMVGDGVNDAAAMAAADIGIAIGNAADVAIETADISLLRPVTRLVPDAIALCRRSEAVLKQGLFWAMVYNMIGIPLAALGVLNPMVAALAMAASSVSVLANALRLRRWKPA
jgi:Cu+-exporting ATPase